MRSIVLIIISMSIFVGTGCSTEDIDVEDPVLAVVHNRKLRQSELRGMYPQGATKHDSVLITNAFVNRWVRDEALLYEAEQNSSADLNIDKLVRDYRSSLVISHYEEVLVSMKMDSTISEQELQEFYNENKNQYQLERPIVRCLFLRIPYPVPNEELLQSLWNNGNLTDTAALRYYAERFAEISLLDPSAWYSLEEIAQQMPKGTLTAENVDSKREFSQQDGSNRYYFKLFEWKPRLEIAPLSYVTEQATDVILHNRKRSVIENAREEIYNRELRHNNIETFTQQR